MVARIAFGAVVAACVLGIAACGEDDAASTGAGGAGESPPAEEVRVAFFHDASSTEYQQETVKAAEEEAARLEIEMDTFSAEFDANTQLTQVEDALAAGKYQAFVLQPMDGSTVCQALQTAAEDGIAVSIYSTPICNDYDELHTDGTIGFFGRDDGASGKFMVDEMSAALHGEGTVGYVSGPADNSTVQWLSDSLKKNLEAHPGLELVAQVDGAWDPAKGQAATQDILQAHPDIDGLFYGVDSMAIPSLEVIRRAGRDDVAVVSLGGSAKAFDAIREGTLVGTMHNVLREEAQYALRAAVQVVRGESIDVPAWNADRKVYEQFEDPLFGGGSPMITRANVDDVEPEWSGN